MRRGSVRTALVVTCGLAALLAAPSAAHAAFAPDAYEPDDTTATARGYTEYATVHTFHSGSDEDWSVIGGGTGAPFVIETVPLDGDRIDTVIEVRRELPDGTTELVASNDDSDTWGSTLGSTLYYTLPDGSTYYVRVRQHEPGGVGRYLLYESQGIAERIAGVSRYGTAAAVSRIMWPSSRLPTTTPGLGPDAVVLATGESYADALGSCLLASLKDTSVLLTRKGALPPETRVEIQRLATNARLCGRDFTVYLVGGPRAVSPAVEAEVAGIAGVTAVRRLAGGTRYGTVAALAEEASAVAGVSTTAWIVTGESFPDAIAAGPVAAANSSPILMTRRTSVPTETLDALVTLGITDVVIVGSERAVDATVEAVIEAALGSPASRVQGGTRYETARAVAQYGVDHYEMDGTTMLLASGERFPDGLAAGPLARWTHGPLLLTTRDAPGSPEVQRFFNDNGPTKSISYAVGGVPAIGASTFEDFKDLWAMH